VFDARSCAHSPAQDLWWWVSLNRVWQEGLVRADNLWGMAVNSPEPPSPFSPAMEGFQTILLAGAVDREAAVGILEAFDDARPSSEDAPDSRAECASSNRQPDDQAP
jgi:hypothetical protein